MQCLHLASRLFRMSTHALASLTEAYTDSEPEGEEEDKILDAKEEEKSESDETESEERFAAPKVPTSRVTTLVSYAAEEEEEDAEARAHLPESPTEPEPETGSVELPPEPTGRVSPRMLEKVALLHKKKESGGDMNALIQRRKDFRNPSIYEKLIQFCGLNELGTNYPPHLYDPLRWGKQSFYDELARVQKVEMDRLEKEKKDRTKVEFVSGLKKSALSAAEEEAKKRKSKWDQVGVGGGGLVRAPPPSLTTAASGTKATVISAFGSLPKKPRI